MLTTGTILQDRYRIMSRLGQGGMGAVYRAWDMRLNVAAALKEMTPQPGLDPQTLVELRRQFQQEAMVLARLNHPHLVRVTDFFEEEDNTYLVMDFVDGESLADRISRQGALPEQDTLVWAGQLLDALAYCHGEGVIHRDIKPQNVIVRPNGRAVLVDFGLVKLWDPYDPHTKTAMRGMGTPEYAPPEQYETDMGHTDARSDIYSLGATLYHSLAGQAPPTATLRMAAPEQFVPVRMLNPYASPTTEAAVLRAMELARSQRWSSAGEMAAALGISPSTTPAQPTAHVAPQPRHAKTQVISTGISDAIPAARPSAPPSRRRVPVWVWALGGLLIILLCVAILGTRAIIVRRARVAATAQARATATARSQSIEATAQAQAREAARVAQATATAQAQATATAQAERALATVQAERATATAQAAQAEATAAAVTVVDDLLAIASSWPVVFSEPFGSNTNDWPAGDYSDERLTGSREIIDGKYHWEADALDGVIWWSIPDVASVSDFYLSVNAQRISGVADGQYGVVFRRADRDNYGLLKIEDSQYFKFSVRSEGEWDTVIDWTETSAIRPVGVNRLAVVGEGSHFSFYINDEYVDEIDEDRLPSGTMGLAIELLDAKDAAVFEFDDFEVRAP